MALALCFFLVSIVCLNPLIPSPPSDTFNSIPVPLHFLPHRLIKRLSIAKAPNSVRPPSILSSGGNLILFLCLL
jgi:hypothetical protein